MHILKIELRNWKSYRKAVFEFPPPLEDKNIILIGARNGYGKTSLFEAVVFCLFGQHGAGLVERATLGKETYKSFLDTALHSGAKEQGNRSCSVYLEFIEDDGASITIKRSWRFNDSGKWLPHDEKVEIYKGTGNDREPVMPIVDPSSDNRERLEWYRDYIASCFLPPDLIHFFLFDGEQVGKLANKDKKDQVRSGIQGLLGITVLNELSQDLQRHWKTLMAGSHNVKDETIRNVGNDLKKLEDKRKCNEKEQASMETELAELEEKRTNLLRDVARPDSDKREQESRLAECTRKADEARKVLKNLLIDVFPQALVGKDLHAALFQRLKAEAQLEKWEAGKKQGEEQLDRFRDSMRKGIEKITPPLLDEQIENVVATVIQSWESLWHPRPSDCATNFRHHYLNTNLRNNVVEQVKKNASLGLQNIVSAQKALQHNNEEAGRIRREMERWIGEKSQEKRENLNKIAERIGKLGTEKRGLENELTSLKSSEDAKRKEYTGLLERKGADELPIRRARCAQKIEEIIKEIITRSVPDQTEGVGEAMTQSYRSMAHKEEVKKVDITKDCEVRLLDAHDKEVYKSTEQSQGEKQIFTLSLFASVASVSGRKFPMIVDTPLARLDTQHRKGVLLSLAQRKHQVILLSTDTEIVKEDLQFIEPHIQKKYLIEFTPGSETDNGIGESNICEGRYFSE